MKTNDDTRHYEGNDLESMASAVNYYQWMLEEFRPFIKGTVLEVGAGSGNFTKYLLKAKPKRLITYEPTGMAEKLKKNLKRYKNVEVVHDFFRGKPKSLQGKTDAIFYINVLEHVEKDEAELKMVYDTLRPGGYLCIYVPALNGLLGSFDEQVGHYRRYSKPELQQKLEACGFAIERLHYSDIYGIVPWYVNFKLLKSKKLNQSTVAMYDKVAIPVIKFQERIFKPPVGKNLWAIARKPV